MVKRTVVVLGILSLMIAASGPSFAFFGGSCGDDCTPKPCYVPVECCPYPLPVTVHKTWKIKIEGPCPPPGIGCGPSMCKETRGGLCEAIANVLGAPLDLLFNHCDSVYGCGIGNSRTAACGPAFGPVPCVMAGVPMFLGAPTTLFGSTW